jgi:hypothetical protein
MSNFEPLPTQRDWREQYSPFPLPGENGLLQPSFEQPTSSNVSDNTQNQQHGVVRPALEHRHTLGPLRQEPQLLPLIERPGSVPVDCGNQVINPTRDDSLVSTDSTALSFGSMGSNPLSSASSAPAQQGTLATDEGDIEIEFKDEEDDDLEDDEMLEGEEGGGSAIPQTAAERRAERRKMKRFRYAHICVDLNSTYSRTNHFVVLPTNKLDS